MGWRQGQSSRHVGARYFTIIVATGVDVPSHAYTSSGVVILVPLAKRLILLLQVFHMVAFLRALSKVAHPLNMPSQAHILPVHLRKRERGDLSILDQIAH